jgi:prepilin-type N-terminal cleavage/methylation domain-containing protein
MEPATMTRQIKRRRAARRRRAGFTLIEMMVALAAGAIAVVSIYYVTAASSHHFHEQQRVAQSQMSLRMAIEQLRRDVSRAGFMASPNSAREKQCVAPSVPIRAVQLTDGGSTAALLNAATNVVQGDTLDMIGNYVTTDSYLAVGSDATGGTLFLQPSWQGFRRSFSQDIGGTFSATAFDDVFANGRWVRIRTRDQMTFFATITGRVSGTRSVTFNPSLPVGTGCVPGLCDGCSVAPIARVQYTLVQTSALGAAGSTLVSASPIPGLNDAALVRREVNIADGSLVAGSERVILEHVAEFDVDFITDDSGDPALPPVLAFKNDAAAQLALAVTPERVRSAIIRLSVHTPGEEPRFQFAARASLNAPLTSFELDPAATGAARVRSETVEVLLTNVATAGMF